MTTSKITRTLRKSGLQEFKILQRDAMRRITATQQGWCLDNMGDHVVVSHSEFNTYGCYEFSTNEKTTAHFQEFSEWLETLTTALTTAGLSVELISGTIRWGSFNNKQAPVIKEIRITA